MRIIPLSVISFYLGLLASFAQTDTTAYQNRKLKSYEVNFISSYYGQTGDHSAVTGGVGTEQLTDFSNALDLTIIKHDSLKSKTWNFELAADTYTSASSDKIDPTTITSASYSDLRIYPSVSYAVRNEQKHHSIGGELYFSHEYDYNSIGAGINFSKASADNNREIALKLQAFFDAWKIILPIELRDKSDLGVDLTANQRNSYNLSIVYSQIVNERLQYALLFDPSLQEGLLSTLFHRIYFNNDSLNVEHLPDNRIKYPAGLRLNWFASEKLVIRTLLRYYTDSWNLNAITGSIELPYKITPLFSLSPFYRYYNQSAAKYFAEYRRHTPLDEFYTSDFDLSAFSSQFFGLNIRIGALNGILGIRTWNILELRYGYYLRSNDLNAHSLSIAATFK